MVILIMARGLLKVNGMGLCSLYEKAIKNAKPSTYDPRARRERHQLAQYNMSPEEYARRMEAQQFCCASCGDALGKDRNTHIDHDHRTGRVRGILCGGCNAGLGQFKDSIDRLERAILYLLQHAD